jgi:hypothetical protein
MAAGSACEFAIASTERRQTSTADMLDSDDAINSALETPVPKVAAFGLDELARLLDHPKLLRPRCEAERISSKDVFLVQQAARISYRLTLISLKSMLVL